jgi:hypothetical protein
MDAWKDDPPPPREFGGIRLIRVDQQKGVDAYITCDRLVGRDTHFVNRRTVPCTGIDCPHDLDGVPARWHGYISICSIHLTTHAVLELTSLAAQPIKTYYERHGSLRGAHIKASRKGNKNNSPVACLLEPSDVDLRTLPRSVNLKRFLCVLWNIPDDAPNGQDAPPLGTPPANPAGAKPSGELPEALNGTTPEERAP